MHKITDGLKGESLNQAAGIFYGRFSMKSCNYLISGTRYISSTARSGEEQNRDDVKG